MMTTIFQPRDLKFFFIVLRPVPPIIHTVILEIASLRILVSTLLDYVRYKQVKIDLYYSTKNQALFEFNPQNH
jgi:hypothetical protein